MNLKEVWKLRKRVEPKFKSSLPIAERNHKSILIVSPFSIKKLLAKKYKQRLRTRPMRPDLGDVRDRKQEIFKLQMLLSEDCQSSPWQMSDLKKALKDLKKNKARDHAGYIN